MTLPKYSKLENERRWLLDSNFKANLEGLPYAEIEDKYLSCGRMRVRSLTYSDGRKEFKLCKKYEPISKFSQPITNIYLTETEHKDFLSLAGQTIKKKRYKKSWNGNEYSIDVFVAPIDNLILCEIESENEESLRMIVAPPFAKNEVTNDPLFSGGELCKITSGHQR